MSRFLAIKPIYKALQLKLSGAKVVHSKYKKISKQLNINCLLIS